MNLKLLYVKILNLLLKNSKQTVRSTKYDIYCQILQAKNGNYIFFTNYAKLKMIILNNFIDNEIATMINFLCSD